jgi:hypothetical protein
MNHVADFTRSGFPSNEWLGAIASARVILPEMRSLERMVISHRAIVSQAMSSLEQIATSHGGIVSQEMSGLYTNRGIEIVEEVQVAIKWVL